MLYALLRLSPVVISPPCHAICLLVATATECTQKKNGCEKVERSTAITPSTSHECVRSRLLCYSTLLLEEEQGMNFSLVRKGIIEIVHPDEERRQASPFFSVLFDPPPSQPS